MSDAQVSERTDDSGAESEDDGEQNSPAESDRPARFSKRKKILAGGAGLMAAAVVGAVLTFALPEESGPPPYTVAVTYKVTGKGKATITYNTGRPGEPGERKQAVRLPWTKKVRVNPDSGPAHVSLVLDKDGGRAQCAVSVHGDHRQRATAYGTFGRATCSAKVPPGDAEHR